ncbi:MAG: ribosomal protein methyltransferase [Clostridiales bacterium]|nr:ribosomal protein methyltransferase [Clostridiales bacterium]MDN5300238.1 ribosomal protein methyltransferase [Clostridiales bacterium]
MQWYEIKVKTAEMSIDAVTYILTEAGANGVMILNPNDPDFTNQDEGKWDFYDPQNIKLDFDGVLITAYLDKEAIEPVLEDLKAKIKGLTAFGLDIGLAEVTAAPVNSSDWENEWKKYFKPFRLGSHMVVKPSWETFELAPDDILIEIDPGNAFGSGTHETTSMCIEQIEKYQPYGKTVIDVGCGSGILAIAAGKLGASSLIAVDIDETAVYTARENLAKNELANIASVRHGNLIEVVEEKGDLVVANIIAEIILILLGDIEKVLKPEATFICSGIINTKSQMVLDALAEKAFEINEIVEKGEWVAITAQKRGQ